MNKRILNFRKCSLLVMAMLTSISLSFADCVNILDDFEAQRNLPYSSSDGSLSQSTANPSPNFVNSSSTCGRYVRTSNAYDNLYYSFGLNGDQFRNGTRIFKLDVYSPAAGLPVFITLINSTLAASPYPAGRHSEYTATTTKANQWETLIFTLSSVADATTPGSSLDKLVIMFTPNTATSRTFYIDNFTATGINTLEDFTGNRHLTLNSYDGTLDAGTNTNPNAANSSPECAIYTRSNAQYDNIYYTTSIIGPAQDLLIGGRKFKVNVYSPAAGIEVGLFLGNRNTTQTAAYPGGFHSYYNAVTTVANQWETLTFDYKYQPDPTVSHTSVDEIVLQFNPNSTSAGNYMYDDIMLVPVLASNPSAITGSTTACKGQINVPYSVSNVSGVSYIWALPTGGSIASGSGTNAINANYSATSVSGTVAVKISNNAACESQWQTLSVTVGGGIANAGPDQTVCTSATTVSLNGTVTGGTTTGTWNTSGTGTFSNANLLNATYTPSAADKAAGSVTLTLVPTGGACPPTSDNMVISFKPFSTVNAGLDQTLCPSVTNVSISGTVGGGATGGTWTRSGTGTFSPSPNSLTATYIPSTADKTAGTVTLTLTTSGSPCPTVSDNLVISFNGAVPTSNAGPDQSACNTAAGVSLNGSIGGSATTATWTSSGTGTFTPNPNTVNATYSPSTADKTGNVTLTLTASGGSCAPVTDNMIISFKSAPTVNAGPDQGFCSAVSSVALAGTVGGSASGGVWTTSGTGTFTNSTLLNTSYTPSVADKTGSVTLTLTTTGSPCTQVSDLMTINFTGGGVTINSQPSDVNICGEWAPGNSYFSVAAVGTGLTYQWQINTGSGFANIDPASIVYANSTTATLTLGGGWASKTYSGYQYRCAITVGGCGVTYSNPATLYVKTKDPDFWTTSLTSQQVCPGGTVSFSTTPSNPTGVIYQWRENRGTSFVDITNNAQYSGATSNKLTISNVTPDMHGYTYQVVVNNGCAAPITTPANTTYLTVYGIQFAAQPTDKTICSGTSTSFSISANAQGGSGAFVSFYQWQVNNGTGFTNMANGNGISGASSAFLSISATAASTMNGYQFRCLATHSNCSVGTPSNSATLTLNAPPTVATQPSNVTIWNAGSATMSVSGVGTNLTYKWQYKTSSAGAFTNIADNTNYTNSSTSTLTIQNAGPEMNGYIYRCIVKSNDCAGVDVPSNEATLTTQTASICMVTVDLATQKNLVIFEKPADISTIDSFKVYREGNVSGQFDLIGRVHKSALSTFQDDNSDPTQQPYIYKLAVKETRGVTSPLSATSHKTMHLTINQGVGNVWNLIWTAYEGITVNTYNIYRGTSSGALTLINSVSGNITSYTDNNAPAASNIYYQIEIVPATSCTPTAKVAATFASIKSNIAETQKTTAIYNSAGVNNFVVYPNPAKESFTIKGLPENATITIYDLSGHPLKTITDNVSTISVNELSRGMYILEVKNAAGVARTSIVIE